MEENGAKRNQIVALLAEYLPNRLEVFILVLPSILLRGAVGGARDAQD